MFQLLQRNHENLFGSGALHDQDPVGIGLRNVHRILLSREIRVGQYLNDLREEVNLAGVSKLLEEGS